MIVNISKSLHTCLGFPVDFSSDSNERRFGRMGVETRSNANCESSLDSDHGAHLRELDLPAVQEMRSAYTSPAHWLRFDFLRTVLRHFRLRGNRFRGKYFNNSFAKKATILSIQPTYARIPGEGLMKLNFVNTLPCDVEMSYKVGIESGNFKVNATNYAILEDLPSEETILILNATAKNGAECETISFRQVNLGTGVEKLGYSVLISSYGAVMFVLRMNENEQIEKSVSGEPYLG